MVTLFSDLMGFCKTSNPLKHKHIIHFLCTFNINIRYREVFINNKSYILDFSLNGRYIESWRLSMSALTSFLEAV